ncbi:TPA: hypothetical protein EYP66_23595 [Candidatus Poribacteria bacterium]|nr:hypothetical protein [Candidatus Poribacteria bacterium]
MYANQEAIGYLERALEFFQAQPADEKQMSLEMTARELLGDVLGNAYLDLLRFARNDITLVLVCVPSERSIG